MKTKAALLLLAVVVGCGPFLPAAGDGGVPDAGSGLLQPSVCAQYIDCQAAIDEDQGTTSAESLKEEYGAEGTCWSSEEDAEECVDQCEDALEQLGEAYPDFPECALPQ